MKNFDEMTSDELLKLAEMAKGKAEIQKIIETKGIDDSCFVPQILKDAEKDKDTFIFKVIIMPNDCTFEYEDKEKVRDIFINGKAFVDAKEWEMQERCLYLPKNFVEDLKKFEVEKFALTGEVPVRLIAELTRMGCEYEGFFPSVNPSVKLNNAKDKIEKVVNLDEAGKLFGGAQVFINNIKSLLSLTAQNEPKLVFRIKR